MQGFNRYIPPDYDPKRTSTLNSYQGKKHALGKRAKDIDKGVLVVRFELPFNVWCEGCGNHIGAGVRYNAQKKRVGNYHSTPIYAFRCKCHLCSSWFEIRTDPQNAAYVVHEGAKRQNDEWDPVANGGFAPIDTEAPSASEPPVDAFASTEKTISQQQWAKQTTSRLTELSEASDRQSLDPYEVSQNLRRRFRVEKAEMLEKQARDEGLRERFGLGTITMRGKGGGVGGEGGWAGREVGVEFDLGEEDVERARGMWVAGRERAGLEVETAITSAGGSGVDAVGAEDGETGSGGLGGDSVRAVNGTPASASGSNRSGDGNGTPRPTTNSVPGLAQALRKSTKRRYDPFADAADGFLSLSSSSSSTPAGKRPVVPARSRLPVKTTHSKEITGADGGEKPDRGPSSSSAIATEGVAPKRRGVQVNNTSAEAGDAAPGSQTVARATLGGGGVVGGKSALGMLAGYESD